MIGESENPVDIWEDDLGDHHGAARQQDSLLQTYVGSAKCEVIECTNTDTCKWH
jgi:hypothetical protein